MNLLEFYKEVRSSFPDVSARADREYIRQWDEEVTDKDAYSWFESVANAINRDIDFSTDASRYKEIFEFISSCYESSDSRVKNCIDVAFVENLFWQTNRDKTASYWRMLPKNLKSLYLNFHGKPPL